MCALIYDLVYVGASGISAGLCFTDEGHACDLN